MQLPKSAFAPLLIICSIRLSAEITIILTVSNSSFQWGSFLHKSLQ